MHNNKNNSLEYMFYQHTSSPTPIPRKNIFIQTQAFEVDESYNGIDESTNKFVSTTMPMPRKPRTKILAKIEGNKLKTLGFSQSTESNTSNKTCSTQEETIDSENSYLHAYLNTSCGSSNLDNNLLIPNFSFKQERNQSENSTLVFDRINKLTRPNAPPPPLPKAPPPFIPPPSPSFFIDRDEPKQSLPYLNSTNDGSELSFPQITSTPSQFFPTTMGHGDINSLVGQCKNIISKSFSKYPLRCNDKVNTHIGFERLTNSNSKCIRESNELRSEKMVISLKERLVILLNLNKYAFDVSVVVFALLLFVLSIVFIILNQQQVHLFFQRFLERNNTINSTKYTSDFSMMGSDLVKQNILLCNGPLFSYQIYNLCILPFSCLLLVIYSFYSKKRSSSHSRGICRTITCKARLGHPSGLDLFQRRNRFLVAALFCIFTNEIFKMIELSMFNATENSSNNTTAGFLNSILNPDNRKYGSTVDLKSNSNADFFRIGLGIEPFTSTSTPVTLTTIKSISTLSGKPFFLFAPSVLRYSKPKLPPRLHSRDFVTTTTTTTRSIGSIIDENYSQLSIGAEKAVIKLNKYKNKTKEIMDSFNRTLNQSANKTLFEMSLSFYENEYIQMVLKKFFESHSLKWTIIYETFYKCFSKMIEVLVIAMRYYPLLGVLDKNSIVCLSLATIYIWIDMVHSVLLTGFCEGLKLNSNFELLKSLKRLFGVEYVIDSAGNLNPSKLISSEIDAKYLYSTNRIFYTVIKSFPHFLSLSYVTIRLTACLFVNIYKKINKKRRSQVKEKIYTQNNYIIDNKNKFSIIYSKKYYDLSEYNQFIRTKQERKLENSLSFEDRYVRNLLKQNTFDKKSRPRSRYSKIPGIRFIFGIYEYCFKWIFDENFRFSTRVVFTYTVCFTGLYYLTCFFTFYGSIFIKITSMPPIYEWFFMIGVYVTSFICLTQLVLSMRKLKCHLQSLYKGVGDKYISPRSFLSNRKITTSSFNYSGFAVTVMFSGYLVIFLILEFILFQVATLFMFGSSTIGFFILVILIPILISVLIIKLVNKFICSLLAKYCFLQKRSKVLALKNIRSFSLFLYFKFFYDCFAGFALCMLRLVNSIILTLLFMPRLDYSSMGRVLEHMDTIFMSYVGFLYIEAHHTNPIMISFVKMLRKEQKKNSKLNPKERASQQTKNRVRNRWHLFCVLSRNLELIKYRRKN